MADTQEIKLWEWCKTHGDYAGYLMRYPNGSYSAEAKALMNGGKTSTTYQAPIQEDSELEYLSWQMQNKEESDLSEAEAFRNCRVLADFEAFVRKYPNGEYTEKAWVVIAKLRKVKQPTTSPLSSQQRPQQTRETTNEDAGSKKCKSITDYREESKSIQAQEEKKFQESMKQRILKDLKLSIACNVVCIAMLIVGLATNRMKLAGLVLLVLGIIEVIVYYRGENDRDWSIEGENYLKLGGYLSLIGGIAFLLI